VNDTERYLFLALIEAVEDIELLFHSLPLDRAPPISVQVKNGNSYKLELVKEDWLSGTMILTGGNRGSSSPDRPIQLERKK
jgi:hypothetical protein